MCSILDFSGVMASDIKECSHELLFFVQNFEKLCPTYKNVKTQYVEVLQAFSAKK